MQIPRLPVSGENLKKYILDTLRGIIDYLKATRLVEGDGISIRETPSGVVVSVIRRGTTSQGASGAAEYDPGIGITITGGTPGVPEKINANITGGTDISVTGGTNGNPLVISYTGGGGGGGGGIPYPDYASLADSSDVPVDVPGIGTTFLLPVRAGVPIEYETDGSNVFAKYAPGVGTSGGSAQLLQKDVSFTPTVAGWVRIRVFDSGTETGKCLRFFSGGVSWSGALPLYKYGTFSNGGGGGDTEAVFISEEPSDATGQVAAQTNKRYYIAIFGDLYHDEDYGYVCQYYLTYDYTTSPPTITRHKTDYTDLSDYGNGYSLELVLPAPSEDRFIDLCLFAFTTILISSSKPIYNYQGSPILQPYPIENRNIKLVYIANDHGGRWYIYNN